MFETPYYIIDEQRLLHNVQQMQLAFIQEWENFQIGYSFKTNNLPWIASWMHKKGVLAEVVSSSEYELAKFIGFNDNEIILNGPHKGNDAIKSILMGGGVLNLDSFEEIDYIESIFKSVPEIRVGLRINFNLEKFCPTETIPGKEPGRFGFNIENGDFERAVVLLKKIGNVQIVGLHGHHSTRTKSLKVFRTIAEKMCSCINYCDRLEYLDFGGCIFGDKPGTPTFSDYARTIVSVMHQYHVNSQTRLILEPGAALIASPISYVCRVIGTKDIQGRRLVYTDGTIKHIAPQMNTIQLQSSIYPSGSAILSQQVISGYTCIENDRFLNLIDEKELKRGDEIVVHNVGAYSMVLSPLFIEYYPQVVVKNGNQYCIAREKWGLKEFMQNNHLCK